MSAVVSGCCPDGSVSSRCVYSYCSAAGADGDGIAVTVAVAVALSVFVTACAAAAGRSERTPVVITVASSLGARDVVIILELSATRTGTTRSPL